MRQLLPFLLLIFLFSSGSGFSQSAPDADPPAAQLAIPVKDRIKLYPNPLVRYLNISVKGYEYEVLDITIRDLIGNVVHENKLEKQLSKGKPFQIDLEKLPEGVYLVDITNADDQQVMTRRILKR